MARSARARFGTALIVACLWLTGCAPQGVAGVTPTATTSPLASPAVAFQPSPTPSPPPAATVTATPIPQPTPTPTASRETLDDLDERPLGAIAPEAEAFLADREGKVGVAVVVPAEGAIYTYNGDQLMSMASVVKVLVMLATLDGAQSEGRPPTERELALMRPMITRSDNDATTALWNALGGAPAVEEYLRSIGVGDIVPNAADQWGASRASARAVAQLFAKLAFDDLLDLEYRATALELLSEVIPDQRWGVTAGTPDEPPEGTIIGLKDGWYPATFGWWVNSAGVIVPGNEKPAYAIAVLTRGQPTWEYGIATIETVAEAVHTGLHGH